MRVIAGNYRGRRIISPEGKNIRPTSDRTKEAVFNIIQWDVEDSVFIDLFSGCGGMGIEALSRGAERVFFSDIDKYAIDLINKNLQGITGNYTVTQGDYKDVLNKYKHHGVQADFVYVDPPYACIKEEGSNLLNAIYNSGILKDDGIVILEHGTDISSVQCKFALYDTRKYGIAVLDFYRKPIRALVSGTFDPFTLGHMFVVEEALKNADKVDIVIFDNPDKQPALSVAERIEIIDLALRERHDYNKIDISSNTGYVADYCKEKGIDVIYRGSRNREDYLYEEEMAKYNYEHSGVDTVIVDAKDKFISSTIVKDRLKDDLSVDKYLDTKIIDYLREKKW